MARDPYVIRRLQELGVQPKAAPAPRPRVVRQPEPVTTDKMPKSYIAKLRSGDWNRAATWFDVAHAFRDGYAAGKASVQPLTTSGSEK
jgi:hypothetical protein